MRVYLDFEKLSIVFESLTDQPVEELQLSGFAMADIQEIMGLAGQSLGSGGSAGDPDEELRREARRFSFEMATDADAAVVRDALAAFGMSGPGDAARALLALARAAVRPTKAEGASP